MSLVPANTRKRKSREAFEFDDLNQDLLERVLSRLPTSSFFRLRPVSKRWSSVAASAAFRLACSQVPSREPWFLMVGQEPDRSSTVYDTSERNWKNLNYPGFLRQARFSESIPVASSGGFVCFRAPSGRLVVCNPVTGACREVPPPSQANEGQALHAIAMNSDNTKDLYSYRIILVSGELSNSNLKFRVFDSGKNSWGDEGTLRRRACGNNSTVADASDTVYFLSKGGEVVATNMERSPSKRYPSVVTVEGEGEEVVHFLSRSGAVVACNLARGTCEERPRLLPASLEYSVDLVECNGEVLAVVMSEFLETASARVWKYSEGGRSWEQVAAMPPAMSHEFYGKKADINCAGCGGSILICVSSSELSSCVMCDLAGGVWAELPKCFVDGRAKEFMSAFSFQPRVEASL